jgi:hypothetical protein
MRTKHRHNNRPPELIIRVAFSSQVRHNMYSTQYVYRYSWNIYPMYSLYDRYRPYGMSDDSRLLMPRDKVRDAYGLQYE